MRTAIVTKLCIWTGVLFLASPLIAREMTPEERFRDQESLQRVYFSHQEGATQSFDLAVPRSTLEKKVRTYLKLSVALEKFWKTPVTDAMLDREMVRMERQTRMPDRLRELYRALDNDPVRIRESLARPALVQRLARNFFDFDQGIHEETRRRAEHLNERLLGRWVDPGSTEQNRTILRLIRSENSDASPPQSARSATLSGEAPGTWVLDAAEFGTWQAKAAGWSLGVSPVQEERDAFITRVLLRESPGEIELAVYTISKRSWEDWWSEVERTLDEGQVRAPSPSASRISPPAAKLESNAEGWSLASQGEIAAALSPEAPCSPDNSWGAIDSPGEAPERRYGHTLVWTGSLVLVWGGAGDWGGTGVNSGGRYDPAIDVWSPISSSNAPVARTNHSAIWTGSQMIVWGGFGSTYLDSGGRYDPNTDTWSSTSSGPAGRYGHSAVWTGSEMIIWGGYDGTLINNQYLQSGARYNPTTDSWVLLSTVNAPVGRYAHAAVWTGSRMVVWGGSISGPSNNTGGRYNPASDTWEPTSVANAPEGRRSFTAVWTGTQMIIWGGSAVSSQVQNTGGRYDPLSDTWSATSTTNAPAGRNGHVAVWTGTRMLVWGGQSGFPYPSGFIATGGQYNPSTDSWSPTSLVNAPAGRMQAGAVWTGAHMVVWGGLVGLSTLNSGGRYNPAVDSWTPTSGDDEASPRRYHTSVWTGTELLIWGGDDGAPLNTGARFDPATAVWTPMTLAGAPAARYSHTAVWTGTQMVVWGGAQSSSVFLGTGGLYNPILDSWAPVSSNGAPPGRYQHTAVWTGSRMIVWGGHVFGADTNTGGLYDPSEDTWSDTSIIDAPTARTLHMAVWTGSRMIVWGGWDNTGGLYDPAGDSWTSTSLSGAPESRQRATAIWTGSSLIIWGGSSTGTNQLLSTGGRYDPSTDTWSPTSNFVAPAHRKGHSAVWTGNLMIVWGGVASDVGTSTNTGGRYEPVTGTWTPLLVTNAPLSRSNHTASWIGNQMLIWGGVKSSGALSSQGGLYCTCATTAYFMDSDGDGFGAFPWVHACGQPPAGYVTNGSDCIDSLASNWSVPGEVPTLAFQDDTTLVWDPPANLGGTSVAYDVIRSGDPANFLAPALCVLDAGGGLAFSDPEQPGSGLTFNYLVRARNNCPGVGSLGTRSDGTPRTALACP